MFHEPTRNHLRAQAGWTLMKRSETTPEHVVALDKYRDGCEALLPFANERAADEEPVGEVKLPTRTDPPLSLEPSLPVPLETVDADSCQHKFNIASQKCVFCGRTYRQIRSRQPELMTP